MCLDGGAGFDTADYGGAGGIVDADGRRGGHGGRNQWRCAHRVSKVIGTHSLADIIGIGFRWQPIRSSAATAATYLQPGLGARCARWRQRHRLPVGGFVFRRASGPTSPAPRFRPGLARARPTADDPGSSSSPRFSRPSWAMPNAQTAIQAGALATDGTQCRRVVSDNLQGSAAATTR